MDLLLSDSLEGLKISSDEENTMIAANNRGIIVSARDVPPAHHLLRFESFSKIGNSKYDSYESNPFEAGGYKWKLVVFPNGHEKRDTKDQYIALYLEICDTESLPPGWEVYANLRLFVFDHIRNTYLSMQDAKGLQRFHKFKTQLGFEKFLPLSAFKDASHGYLEDDCCVFGAEVFVIKPNGKGDCLCISNNPSDGTYTWTVNNFSLIEDEYIYSEAFTIGDYKWKLLLYPNGYNSSDKQDLSLYLVLDDTPSASEWEMDVEFKFWVRDQIHGKHFKEKEVYEYTYNKVGCNRVYPESSGFPKFLSLEDLYCSSNGYLVNDTVIFEVEISYVCVSTNL